MREIACPCGSGRRYPECCGAFIEGGEHAPNPERLMRSRFTAYALDRWDYIAATWDPRTRPSDLSKASAGGIRWTRLEVRNAEEDGEGGGIVEFVAHFLEDGRPGTFHERSRFHNDDGQWLYTDGEILAPASGSIAGRGTPTPGRNAPCPCGSGRKYKRCCGR